MNYLLGHKSPKLIIKRGIRITKDALEKYKNGMKKQGVPSGTLTMRDFRNHLILKG